MRWDPLRDRRIGRQTPEVRKRALRVLNRQVMAGFELRRRTQALVESEALLFKCCPAAPWR